MYQSTGYMEVLSIKTATKNSPIFTRRLLKMKKSRFTQILSANTPERMTDMVTKFLKTTSLHSWHISADEKFAIVGTVFDGGFDAKCELSEKVKHTAFDDFISIANDVNRLLYDIDPYEYRDNDGVESVDDIAVKLLYTAYRNTVIHKLQEYYDYYMENKEENPDFEHLAERCENITNRLAEYNKQN